MAENEHKIRIIPLGGVDEFGKNITVVEYGEDMLVVDCGSIFPKEDMLGIDLVIPVLCTVALVLNFIFAFVNRRFTENGLVYLLLNIVVGVVPYIGLTLRHSVRPPMAWVICLVISMITFLGLVIFKGRSLLAEFEKRLHL